MSLAEEAQQGKATFYVHWYDVGKSALEGLKGVNHVTSGFHGAREINTVLYNPDLVSIEQMVEALKQAGTYIGTVE